MDRPQNPKFEPAPNVPTLCRFVFGEGKGPLQSQHEGAPPYYRVTISVDGKEHTWFLNAPDYEALRSACGGGIAKNATCYVRWNVKTKGDRGSWDFSRDGERWIGYADAPGEAVPPEPPVDSLPPIAYVGAIYRACLHMAAAVCNEANDVFGLKLRAPQVEAMAVSMVIQCGRDWKPSEQAAKDVITLLKSYYPEDKDA